ncbi:protein TIS11 [Culicoides brevitarsis]|uniref:protein TIS11 n=1 Tax=Culicoides brevitarsis TaxID=469753 RepID=UPI00307B4037
MSTAIMHSGPFYDFGDLILKNQPSTRTTQNGLNLNSGSTQSIPALIANTNSQINHQHLQQQKQQQQQYQQQQTQQPQAQPNAGSTVTAQQQLSAAQQQKMLLHNALTRAVSHPVGGQQAVQLLTSISEILGSHKKLERTQSEPLPQLNTSRYKTELCRPYEEAGECKYGDKCQFAHGIQELRNLQRHPKYKTELCRTFHSVGFCPYGPRCHFVHNAEEARNHNRNVAAYHARLAAQNAAAATAAMHGMQLPLSPPLSMSTGSDRASPTGSLSLSPTNSMVNFFPEQSSPTQQTFHAPSSAAVQAFSFTAISPPASPIATTPPPTIVAANNSAANTVIDEARLPVFNRLSSTIDAFTNLQL